MSQPRYVSQAGVGSTPWQIVSTDISPFSLGIGVLVSGTVSYTFEYTYEDPSGTYPHGTPTAWPLAALATKAAATDSSIAFPIAAWRLTVVSGTGTATACVIQAGIAGN